MVGSPNIATTSIRSNFFIFILFDFSNFSGDQNVAILLDTPGLWQAIISLYSSNHIISVQGTSTFNVQYGNVIDEGTDISIDELMAAFSAAISGHLSIEDGVLVCSSIPENENDIYEIGQWILLDNDEHFELRQKTSHIVNEVETISWDIKFNFKNYFTKNETENLFNIYGRFLGYWHASHGWLEDIPDSVATENFVYKPGDYALVETEGNLIPNGDNIPQGTTYGTFPHQQVSENVIENDIVFYTENGWVPLRYEKRDSIPSVNVVTKNSSNQAEANGFNYSLTDSNNNTYTVDLYTALYNGESELCIRLTNSVSEWVMNYLSFSKWTINADIVCGGSSHFLGTFTKPWKTYAKLMGSNSQTTFGLVSPDTSNWEADKTIATLDDIHDTTYTAGTGISISNNNVIGIDSSTMLTGGQTAGLINASISLAVTTIKTNHVILVNTTTYPTLESFLLSTGDEGSVYWYPIDINDLTKGYHTYIWENNNFVFAGDTIIDLSNVIASGIQFTTTAPTAANTNGLKVVVLSSEPQTRYSGYIYIITGSNQ